MKDRDFKDCFHFDGHMFIDLKGVCHFSGRYRKLLITEDTDCKFKLEK